VGCGTIRISVNDLLLLESVSAFSCGEEIRLIRCNKAINSSAVDGMFDEDEFVFVVAVVV
jgi:hypothetical protein